MNLSAGDVKSLIKSSDLIMIMRHETSCLVGFGSVMGSFVMSVSAVQTYSRRIRLLYNWAFAGTR